MQNNMDLVFDYTGGITSDEPMQVFEQPEPVTAMTFEGPDKREAGRLSWGDGVFRFEGDADACAKSFIGYLNQYGFGK